MQREAGEVSRQGLATLTVGALGVVYGDIGTSPLYALRECFQGPHAVAVTPENVLGVVSLIFWALVIVISLKYATFVLRADNRGEGGILALLAMNLHRWPEGCWQRAALITLGVFSATMFFGDGMITPAISVLSAVEGLAVATDVFEPFVLPITVAILIALFYVQSHGSERVGRLFGPVMITWFAVLAVLGLNSAVHNPEVFQAINPGHAWNFFAVNRWHGFVVLGAVVLVVTGGEAMYADMGHFGRRPVRLAWFAVVLPAVLLNYFGQGALLLRDAETAASPFYHLAPDELLYPLVALSTLATVIASQAVISGVFSVTRQAIQLGFAPRVEIVHTSEREIGQIYVPAANWALLVAVLGLVLGFGSSSNLAAAYGIAVTMDMVITTLMALVTARFLWGWNWWRCALVAALFWCADLALFAATSLKIPQGGWFPLLVGLGLYTLMLTWKRGRELVTERLRELEATPLAMFIEGLADGSIARVPGTAVFLTRHPQGVPHTLLHNLKHNKVLHERVVLLTALTEDVPRVAEDERVAVEPLGNAFYRVTARYGFVEDPDVPHALALCASYGLQLEPMETTFFLGRETLISTAHPGMARWRERLFIGMWRNAAQAMDFFGIPTNRVVELGTQLEL